MILLTFFLMTEGHTERGNMRKVRFNISAFLVCECGSSLYGQPNGEYVIAVCLSPMCEDFNVQKIVRAIEVPYTLSPTKVTLDAFGNLDLGEQEAQKQRE